MKRTPAQIDTLMAIWGVFSVVAVLAWIMVANRDGSGLAGSIANSVDKTGLSVRTLRSLGLLSLTAWGMTWGFRHIRHKMRLASLNTGAALMSFNDLKVVPNAPLSYLSRTQSVLNRLAKASQLDTVASSSVNSFQRPIRSGPATFTSRLSESRPVWSSESTVFFTISVRWDRSGTACW